MSERMKGFTCCGDCINYNYKKHKCNLGASIETDARSPFYDDCPIPDIPSEQEIRDMAIEDYQKECAKFILNKRNEFVNKIQRRANDRMREAIVAETRTVSCYKTGIKEGLEEAVEVFDEIAEQMKEVGE